MNNYSTAHISFYDMNGKEMPFHGNDYKPINVALHLSSEFDEMKKIAIRLAEKIDVPFVRIDLYPIKEEGYIFQK